MTESHTARDARVSKLNLRADPLQMGGGWFLCLWCSLSNPEPKRIWTCSLMTACLLNNIIVGVILISVAGADYLNESTINTTEDFASCCVDHYLIDLSACCYAIWSFDRFELNSNLTMLPPENESLSTDCFPVNLTAKKELYQACLASCNETNSTRMNNEKRVIPSNEPSLFCQVGSALLVFIVRP